MTAADDDLREYVLEGGPALMGPEGRNSPSLLRGRPFGGEAGTKPPAAEAYRKMLPLNSAMRLVAQVEDNSECELCVVRCVVVLNHICE